MQRSNVVRLIVIVALLAPAGAAVSAPSGRQMVARGVRDVGRGISAYGTALGRIRPLVGYKLASDSKKTQDARGAIQKGLTDGKRATGSGLKGIFSGIQRSVADPLHAAANKVHNAGAAAKRTIVARTSRTGGKVKAAGHWTRITANKYKSSGRYTIKMAGYKLAGDKARARKANTTRKAMLTKGNRRISRAARALAGRLTSALFRGPARPPTAKEQKMVFSLP